MGIENCKTEQNVSTQPCYHFKQLEFDINSVKRWSRNERDM